MCWCWFRSVSTFLPLHPVSMPHVNTPTHTCPPPPLATFHSIQPSSPPQGSNISKLTGEASWCVCVCVLGLNTLFVVCVWSSVWGGEGKGGKRGSRWAASPQLYALSLIFSLTFTVVPFFPSSMSSSFSLLVLPPIFCPLFPSLLCCGRWQRGSGSSSHRAQARVWAGDGERRRGNGKKRRREEEVGVRHMESLVKGPPQRECACACSSVMNRGGRGDRIQWMPIKTEIWLW